MESNSIDLIGLPGRIAEKFNPNLAPGSECMCCCYSDQDSKIDTSESSHALWQLLHHTVDLGENIEVRRRSQDYVHTTPQLFESLIYLRVPNDDIAVSSTLFFVNLKTS